MGINDIIEYIGQGDWTSSADGGFVIVYQPGTTDPSGKILTQSRGYAFPASGLGGGGGSVGTLQEVLDAGNTTTNNIEFDAGAGVVLDNSSILREGTIDAGAGGGIAQICGVGYELKWEAGSQYVMNNDGTLIREVNHKFNTAPGVSNDDTEGFYVGSRWILDDGTIYICSDATTGAAVWDVTATTITSITYADLVTAITNSTLVKLGWYLLTDFELTHEIPNSGGATWTSPVEPILIQAIDVNKLADYGYSQTWKDEIVYYTTDNNQTAVLGCTKGYVRRRVNNTWNLDLATDYRNNRYRRFAIDAPAYNGATNYAQYDTVEDGGVIFGSLQNANTGNATSDAAFWVNLGYNNGEYWGLTDTTWTIAAYVITTDAADFEDSPMLDPTDLDAGYYFQLSINSERNVNQLNNVVIKGNSYFGINNVQSLALLYDFTIDNSSFFTGGNLSNGGIMNSFTLNNGGAIGYISVDNNSAITSFVIDNSELFTNSFINGSQLYEFTLINGSQLNYLTVTSSSFFNFRLTGQTIQNLSIQNATVLNLDTTTATVIFDAYTKTITARADLTSRISYIDNSDVLQIVDINT